MNVSEISIGTHLAWPCFFLMIPDCFQAQFGVPNHWQQEYKLLARILEDTYYYMHMHMQINVKNLDACHSF